MSTTVPTISCSYCGWAEYVTSNDWERAVTRKLEHQAQCEDNPRNKPVEPVRQPELMFERVMGEDFESRYRTLLADVRSSRDIRIVPKKINPDTGYVSLYYFIYWK